MDFKNLAIIWIVNLVMWIMNSRTCLPSWLNFANCRGLCTNHVDKWRVRGVAQMSTLLNKSYLVKVSTKGGGGSIMPQILSTWFVHTTQPLSVYGIGGLVILNFWRNAFNIIHIHDCILRWINFTWSWPLKCHIIIMQKTIWLKAINIVEQM